MRTPTFIFLGVLLITTLAQANSEASYDASSSYNRRNETNANAQANYNNDNNWNNEQAQNSGQVNYSRDANYNPPSKDRWGNRQDRNDGRGSTYDNSGSVRHGTDTRYNRSGGNMAYDGDEMDEGNYIQSQRNRGQTGAGEDKWSRTQRMYDAEVESRARRY